jgi:ribonuclease R
MSKKLKELTKDIQKAIESFGKAPFNNKQISAKLDLSKKEAETVQLLLDQMTALGELEEIDRGRYRNLNLPIYIEGKLDLNIKGNGYLVPDEGEEDIFIPAAYLNKALDNDRVKVQLFARRKGKKPEGEIVEIISRYRTEFVGKIELQKNFAFLVPDNKKMYADIYIPLNKLNGAQHGDKVLVKLTEWTNDFKNPFGEVLQVFGKPLEHQAEMNAIVAEFGFANSFPKEVEDEAALISETITADEIAQRRDFRNILTLTIDPEDAKDFDDAISYQILPNGRYEIGVHIADVSHYIQEGTALEKEAEKRATSVYLVDRTIPMLPEKLSNGLCSLRPNEDKLTFSAVFEMDDQGKVYTEWFGKTIIHSARRFTYEEAQERIESGTGDLAEELITLNNIAHHLKDAKFKNGAISFETQEVKFKLADDGTPLSVYTKIRKDAHKLVEEFMLLANKKVAEFVYKKNNKKTFVYRVHDSPNMDKLDQFTRFSKRFGYKMDLTNNKTLAKSFNTLLEHIEGKPEQNLLQSLAIRTMAKAIYTTKKTEHYGLAFDFYTHFTSPIRRYPDLMVHRLLFAYLHHKPAASASIYEEKCKHSSKMEAQAAEAERASIKYKQVEYMKASVGKIFDGIISGVTEWGIYVEIIENKCEGMIRVSSMRGDFYEYDEKNLCLTGVKKKKKYTLGDAVKVQVAKADMDKRQLDFEII